MIESKILPLTCNEIELVEMMRLYPKNSAYNIGYIIHSEENYDLKKMLVSLQSVHKKNCNLRAALVPQGKKITNCDADIEFRKTSGITREDVEEVFQSLKSHLFSLSIPPLYKVVYFDDQENGSYVVVVANKFIVDALSLYKYTQQFTQFYQDPPKNIDDDFNIAKKVAYDQQGRSFSFKPECHLFQCIDKSVSPFAAISISFSYTFCKSLPIKKSYGVLNTVVQRALLDYFQEKNIAIKYMHKNRLTPDLEPFLGLLASGIPFMVSADDTFDALFFKNLNFLRQQFGEYIRFDDYVLKYNLKHPVEICINYIPRSITRKVNGLFTKVPVASQQHMWADNVKLIISIFHNVNEYIIELRALKAYLSENHLHKIEQKIVAELSNKRIFEELNEEKNLLSES